MDFIVEQAVSLLVSLIKKGGSEIAKKVAWKGSFKKASELAVSASKNLSEVFSSLNTKEAQKSLKRMTGYSLYNRLGIRLKREIERQDLDPKDFSAEIDQYIEALASFLIKKFPEYAIELKLDQVKAAIQESKKEIGQKIDLILKKLDALESVDININTLLEEEDELINKSKEGFRFDLGSFWFDYSGNIKALDEGMEEKESFYLSCFDKEEVKYQLLNYLLSKVDGSSVLIVKSKDSWSRLRKEKIQGACLILDFDVGKDLISPIKGNKNFFLLARNESMGVPDSDIIQIRRRASNNIKDSLKQAYSGEKPIAFDLFSETNGIYANLKPHIFNGVADMRYQYEPEHLHAILCGLLLGSFTQNAFSMDPIETWDTKLAEELFGAPYNRFVAIIKKHSRGSHPIFVAKKVYSKITYATADPKFAWKQFAEEIDDVLWNKFIGILPRILFADEVGGPSEGMRKAVLETLLISKYLTATEGVCFNKNEGSDFVSSFLKGKQTGAFWTWFIRYSRSFAELNPKEYLAFLANHVSSPELKRRFKEDRQYTNVIWALEALSRNEQWQGNAIDCLFGLNTNIEKALYDGNSPKRSLATIFVYWLDQCGLGIAIKKQLLTRHLNDGWEVISQILPYNTTTVSSLAETYYLPMKEENRSVSIAEAREYLALCIDLLTQSKEGGAKRIEQIVEALEHYDEATQKRILGKLETQITSLPDDNKEIVASKIREKIAWIRFYRSNEIALNHFSNMLEELLGKIRYENPYYGFFYLTKWKPPVLHPTNTYKGDFVERDDDEKTELKNGAKAFKDQGLNLLDFVKTLNDESKLAQLGRIVQQYFGDLLTDQVFQALCAECKRDNTKYFSFFKNLIATKTNHNPLALEQYFEIAKDTLDAESLGSFLRDYTVLEGYPNLIEKCSEETKASFWSSDNIRLDEKGSIDFLKSCLQKVAHYGNAFDFFEMVGTYSNRLDIKTIYDLLIAFDKDKLCEFKQDLYYYTSLTAKIAPYVFSDEKRIRELADIERCLFKNYAMLGQELTAYQWLLKNDPSEYSRIILSIFGKNENNLHFPYDFSYVFHVSFCPAEENGHVNQKKLHEWLQSFRKTCLSLSDPGLFENQLGHLLAFAPPGNDGYFPCEAIRNEVNEIADWIGDKETFVSAYVVAECNKRGVYTPNAGEGEIALATRYRENSLALKENCPLLYKVYDVLAKSYLEEAGHERERAENGGL